MDAWIPITIAAAAAQTIRFMVQKHLASGTLTATGATLARFLYSAPLAAAFAFAYAQARDIPIAAPDPAFWAYAVSGGIAQILATVCVVALFAHRNFAVGITYKKTEVILTAIVGWLILGDRISLLGGAAILIGFLGVLWLSDEKQDSQRWRIFNRAAALGLLSGVFFAISAVGYRGAVLSIEAGDTAFRAAITLAIVTLMQTALLVGWLIWRDRAELAAVVRSWRTSALVGLFSLIGSFCWFAAFSLQNAAYVFALGQVELIFSIVAATLWFRERITRRELAGMTVLTVSIILLVVVA